MNFSKFYLMQPKYLLRHLQFIWWWTDNLAERACVSVLKESEVIFLSFYIVCCVYSTERSGLNYLKWKPNLHGDEWVNLPLHSHPAVLAAPVWTWGEINMSLSQTYFSDGMNNINTWLIKISFKTVNHQH